MRDGGSRPGLCADSTLAVVNCPTPSPTSLPTPSPRVQFIVSFNGTLASLGAVARETLQREGIAALIARFSRTDLTTAHVDDSHLESGSILLVVTFTRGSISIVEGQVVASGITAASPLDVTADGILFRSVNATANESAGPVISIPLPRPAQDEATKITLAEFAFLGSAGVLLLVFIALAAGSLKFAVDHAMLSGVFALTAFSALGGTVLAPDGFFALGLSGDSCTLAAAAMHLMLVAVVAWSAVFNFYAFCEPEDIRYHIGKTFFAGWVVPTIVSIVCVVLEVYPTSDDFCYFTDLTSYYFGAGVPVGVMLLGSIAYYVRGGMRGRSPGGPGLLVLISAAFATGAATTLHFAVTNDDDMFTLITAALTVAYTLSIVAALVSRIRQRRKRGQDLAPPPPGLSTSEGAYQPGGSRSSRSLSVSVTDFGASNGADGRDQTASPPIKVVPGKAQEFGRRSIAQPISVVGETSF